MTLTQLPSLDDLICKCKNEFKKLFAHSAELGTAAPGRVNLIGEHIDYLDGYVLPFAISMWTIALAKPRTDRNIHIVSLNSPNEEENKIQIDIDKFEEVKDWSRYVRCVIKEFQDKFCSDTKYINNMRGLDILLNSSVPLGAGLSSSASLEVAIFSLLQTFVFGEISDRISNAKLCQMAEHRAGVPCGIMDQMASFNCSKNNLILLDCKENSFEQVPVNPDVAFLVVDSGVKHNLGDGPYRERRTACEIVIKRLNLSSFRQLTENDLCSITDDVLQKRAKHGVTEIKRTLECAEQIKLGNINKAGILMRNSHESLRKDYEVSCDEIDCLVDAANMVDGVYGARITGGGFGGCCVVALPEATIANCIDKMSNAYSEKFPSLKPKFYHVSPENGCCDISHKL